MDLFAASGIDLGDGGAGGRTKKAGAIRSLKTPLLKHKVVQGAVSRFTFDWSDRQTAAAVAYAETVRSKKFARMKETAVRPLLFEKVFGDLLGFVQVNPGSPHSIAFEFPLRGGSVDAALGRFGEDRSTDRIVAPLEIKGAGTDLDAIMPGRGRSPVQQAWDYANDAPGCRWVLVSNCVELRLYGFGRGRDAYEVFDLSKLDDRYERERLWFLLSADRLLGGGTDALLKESDSAYKTVTDELYLQYNDLRRSLIDNLAHAADGPKLTLAGAIEPAQKILDRILFIAFAQRTALLPDRLLEDARTTVNKFQPAPIWRNFQQLFRAVDRGEKRLDIWPYNGGLFAHDPVVDAIEIPDHLAASLARLGEWDYRDDVPVTLLGHLFEQSVTDLEKLRAEARGEAAPKVAKKKREGVVYTPDMVTRFLTAKTIGLTLSERFDALLEKHGRKPPKNGETIFTDKEREIETAFWRDYAEALRALTIVDPACGSGAFLVAAFDLLAAEYSRVARRLSDLESPIDFDPFDEIVTKNLYGVDLNAESVEITRLALWLKTARTEHRLQNLEATIRVGNSLIDDPAFSDRPFDWRKAFPEVFAAGGFDIVIGNPPYVRMEFLKPVKPFLEKHYVVAADRADLYAYFFEKGVSILKQGGRLGFISSSTFFRTGSGENLRTFLGDKIAIEAIVDFGDLQIFEGVTTYPAILTLKKEGAGGELSFLKLASAPDDLDSEFSARAQKMPRARLGKGSWQFEGDALARLRDKIVKGKKTLGEVYGAPAAGIKTGLNDAFIFDQTVRDRLIETDRRSGGLIVKLAMGDSANKWALIDRGNFLLYVPRDTLNIDEYPTAKNHLAKYRDRLESRALDQQWFELQQAQQTYVALFQAPKIVWRDISAGPTFSIDRTSSYLDMTCFCLPTEDESLLAILNCKLSWFFWKTLTPELRGGFVRLKRQFVSILPLPNMNAPVQKKLSSLAALCRSRSEEALAMQSAVRHRISADLGNGAKLSRKLEDWHELDFAQFRAEVKRVFKTEIPVKQRGQWETYLAEEGEKVRKLTAEIEAAEREIDKVVYKLFDLNADEIALLEASIEGQY